MCKLCEYMVLFQIVQCELIPPTPLNFLTDSFLSIVLPSDYPEVQNALHNLDS